MIKKINLEKIYKKYNNKKYLKTDPLSFVHLFKRKKDQEIIGLIASTLAYGRVTQIKKSIIYILDKMGKKPKDFIEKNSYKDFLKIFINFRHRFTDGIKFSKLLKSIKLLIEKYGTLEKAFLEGYSKKDKNLIPAMTSFVKKLECSNDDCIVANPNKKSACKRLSLYIKWMVRNDEVDLGTWKKIDKSKLIIPLDTHIYKFGIRNNFTKRKAQDLKTAIEITEKFKEINASDPTKYDFSITRSGIIKNNQF
jgi:uncharacterized protein (TIGR02757 family)